MAVELPDVVDINTVKLEPNLPFYYAVWGIRYKISPAGKWRVAAMSFRRKVNAESWIDEHYAIQLRDTGGTAEVVPVKHTLLMDSQGNIQRFTEELTEE